MQGQAAAPFIPRRGLARFVPARRSSTPGSHDLQNHRRARHPPLASQLRRDGRRPRTPVDEHPRAELRAAAAAHPRGAAPRLRRSGRRGSRPDRGGDGGGEVLPSAQCSDAVHPAAAQRGETDPAGSRPHPEPGALLQEVDLRPRRRRRGLPPRPCGATARGRHRGWSRRSLAPRSDRHHGHGRGADARGSGCGSGRTRSSRMDSATRVRRRRTSPSCSDRWSAPTSAPWAGSTRRPTSARSSTSW
jgi:hypothetical protein